MTALTGNALRADRAANTLLAYAQRYDDGTDVETALTDLLADVMHMLDQHYGFDIDEALGTARMHFDAETHGEE
jgi:hypothetical protein